MRAPPDPSADFDDKAEAEALRLAGDDRCARTYIRLARVHNDHISTKARAALDEVVGLAEACGDDRARADALISAVAWRITLFGDPKLPQALSAAEGVLHRHRPRPTTG